MFSSEGGLSDQEEENEENTSEHSVRHTPDTLLSSLSADNLQMELSKCSSDGLSDKENVVRNLRNQVKPHLSLASVCPQPLDDSESSSEYEGPAVTSRAQSPGHASPATGRQPEARQNGW